ncbi:OsmC family protein [Neobacillus mesonae]|uniref:OsmC family protein n=1 Tax=Neobacillus mesonae TaxID=1193713 RepID=UPI00203AEDB8|nr:OsmC family protein [Neobacillus mesonae]MCM3568666.1 OsmC family protein [Neobacillus mesonae]
MQITANWNGKRSFTAEVPSGFPIKMDTNEQYGGEGKGNTPLEMLLSALAGCIGIDVTMILKPYLDQITNIRIEVNGKRGEEPPKPLTDIEVVFIVDGNIEAKKVWRAIHLGKEKYCVVSASLAADVTFKLILNGQVS